MKFLKRSLSLLVALSLFVAPVFSQTYPTTNPTYIPNSILAASTLTSAGTATFQTNGVGTLYFRVAGTNTAFAATIQGTEARAGTPVWSTLSAQNVAGGRVSSLVTNGLYRVDAAGLAQVRVNVTSITGTNVIISASGGPGVAHVSTLPSTRSSYAATAIVAPASSPTDIITVSGSATTTVRINKVMCSGVATSTATGTLLGVLRSTATTGGTSSAATMVRLDQNNPTASAVVTSFTANPTVGSSLGNIRASTLTMTATTSSVAVTPLVWDFGNERGTSQVVLRGAAQQFALNGNAVSFPAGSSLQCTVEFTEE